MTRLTDEELLDTLATQLPALLERHPELEDRAYFAFIRAFATRKEVAAIIGQLEELRGDTEEFRNDFREFVREVRGEFQQIRERFATVAQGQEVEEGFARVTQRFETVAQRQEVREEFDGVAQRFDRLELLIGRLQTRTGESWKTLSPECCGSL